MSSDEISKGFLEAMHKLIVSSEEESASNEYPAFKNSSLQLHSGTQSKTYEEASANQNQVYNQKIPQNVNYVSSTEQSS